MEPTPYVDSNGNTLHVDEWILIDGKRARIHKQYQVLYDDYIEEAWFDIYECKDISRSLLYTVGDDVVVEATGEEVAF